MACRLRVLLFAALVVAIVIIGKELQWTMSNHDNNNDSSSSSSGTDSSAAAASFLPMVDDDYIPPAKGEAEATKKERNRITNNNKKTGGLVSLSLSARDAQAAAASVLSIGTATKNTKKINNNKRQRPPPPPPCTGGIRFKDPSMRICNFIKPGKPNFGDEMGPPIIRRMLELHFNNTMYPTSTCAVQALSVDMRRRRKSNETCLLSLGSILHFVKAGDHVWSTGINLYRQKLIGKYPNNVTYHSVRGPKAIRFLQQQKNVQLLTTTTATIATTINGTAEPSSSLSFPYGDPGILVPALFPQHRPKKQKQKIVAVTNNDINPQNKNHNTVRRCFIPHNSDGEHNLKRLRNYKDENSTMKIIRASLSWHTVFQQLIQECDTVASSSLHGLISADALQLPSMWFQWTNSNTSEFEGSFKYLDYLESIQRISPVYHHHDNDDTSTSAHKKKLTAPALRPYSTLESIMNDSAYFTPLLDEHLQQIIQRTKSSFPYHLFEVW